MKLNRDYILFIGLFTVWVMSGCVKEDANQCGNTGINLSFYTLTPCQTDTVYAGMVSNLIIGVFNSNHILTTYATVTDAELTHNYFRQIEVPEGLYTVIAWTGINSEQYEITTLQEGVTTKNDLLFRLKRAEGKLSPITGTQVFFGESPAVYIPENREETPLFEEVAINLREITNRITITVEGIPAEYSEIALESANGSMNMMGTIVSDEVMEYTPDRSNDTGTPEAAFTTLKLATGYQTSIVVRDITSPDGQEIFRGDLLGTLLFKNPEINLECDHDFTIRFTVQDQCNCGTFTIAQIWVNNWLVHSYDTEM